MSATQMINTFPSTASWPIPELISEALKNLQAAVDRLGGIAGHQQKKFTLDGRLVGDIGEVIAAHYFEIELTDSQEKGFDATITKGANKGGQVEVKCRRMAKNIEFKEQPEFLIVLRIDENDEKVELVYAGSGSVISKIRPVAALKDSSFDFTSKQRISLTQLRAQFDYATFLQNSPIPASTEASRIATTLPDSSQPSQ